jgi:hypothetical protein
MPEQLLQSSPTQKLCCCMPCNNCSGM